MARKPRGYVVESVARANELDTLIGEYEASRDTRVRCRVCECEHRELIDELLRRGGGGPSIARFLAQRLNFKIGSSTIGLHRMNHLNAESNAKR